MATKTRKISTLIESQLPGFIATEYENFSKFVEKYYEHLESSGQPLDIITNLQKYRDINFYEKNLLNQNTTLSSNVLADSTTITVEDATSFPEENGYIQIGDEICFYQSRTNNQFLNVSRGVSGNTTLGDLYTESTFVTTQATPHYTGDSVHNVSNLFLYAIVKNFESQYLKSFPEKYLKGEVDKRTLIKNIGSFYKAKGTDRSIKFLFNTIIAKEDTDIPEVYNPKDFTLKASVSDWVQNYTLKVKITSGDPMNLLGNYITQSLDDYDSTVTFATAVVDNVIFKGTDGIDDIYEVTLETSTLNGEFTLSNRTETTKLVSSSLTTGDRINVKSTVGFPKQGKLLIGDEVITYNDKTVTQFIIDSRLGPIRNHISGKPVYRYSTVSGSGVKMIVFGAVYNLLPSKSAPYSETKNLVQVGNPGFSTLDPIIYKKSTKSNRWIVNTNPETNYASSSIASIDNRISKFTADISGIFEDDQYFYICSSSYPSRNILTDTSYDVQLDDQKHLKLIRKVPTTTTEVYKTTDRDTGIFIDGVPALGYRDSNFIKFGKIVSTKIENPGTGYGAAPYVLINEIPGKAAAVLSGSTIDSISILTEETFTEDPVIRITSGEDAVLSPVITNGGITSLTIKNPGRYYSSPPVIRIVDSLGKGNFAEYEAIIDSEGKLIDTKKISIGRFYTRGFVQVFVEPVGKNAAATCEIKKWVYDRYTRIKNNLDSSNGTVFQNYLSNRNYGYGYVANPSALRTEISDNNPNTHSPIIGYAYDGNPIYGPYGYSDPTNPQSSVTRLSSGYQLKNTRESGPDIGRYKLGTFIDDYQWTPSINSGKTELDSNNGRFCVTPDYPNGVYAYFITIDQNSNPVFPYIIGENYYSLPVDSNYNSAISQDDLPFNVKALRTSATEDNGVDFSGYIQDVKRGNVTSVYVEDSPNTFSPGNIVHINNEGTEGYGSRLVVGSVEGKQISSIESKATLAERILVQESAYMFAGDTVFQDQGDGTVVEGELIGDVINSSEFVLRSCNGEFLTNVPLSSSILVVRLVLNADANFTIGATMTLTNDDNEVIAKGVILETILRQNSVKIKVESGEFIPTDDYYLRSTDLSDTNRVQIISVQSLSTNLTPYFVDSNIAIVETEENHNLGDGDEVIVDILPDDDETETTYYVRKRLYQSAVAFNPVHTSKIVDTGIGSADVLNTGKDYTSGTYTNVELIFQDQSKVRKNIGAPGDSGNARATAIIADFAGVGIGGVSTLIITSKGVGYKRGDILTIADSSLDRVLTSENNQRFVMEVDHVGFAAENTVLYLTNVNNISQDDFLQIGQEVVKVTSVDVVSKEVTVTRGEQNTIPTNFFDGAEVKLKDGYYRFDENFRPFGEEISKPYLISYDKETQEINVAYEYSILNPQRFSISSSFFDNSVPQKLVKFRTVDEARYKLEFSRSNTDFITNPVIQIQKYYKYTFDVSHPSMSDTFLDFSSSSNYNIFTEEKVVSSISPGNSGSFISIKLGFGPAISSNTYQNRRSINFQNYFYFIKVSPDVDTGGSYLRIVDDPLVGTKSVVYVTDKRFVYALDGVPEYDGTGQMTYTTNSSLAVGKIVSVKVINSGENYSSIPVVFGVSPTFDNEAEVDPVWNPFTKTVDSFVITNKGKNYSKPFVVVTEGDGIKYEYDCVVKNGELVAINILKPGKGFTFKPKVRIVESDVKIYLESNNIGLPQNVKINNPGKGYHNNRSILPKYTSPYTFVLRNISDRFFFGENIYQDSTGASAVVSNYGWRQGSNLLKVENIQGVFETGGAIRSSRGDRTATLYSQLYTEFEPDIKSYIDNYGFYTSDRGRLSNANQKLQDSYYFQDYSYVIKSKTPIEVWRDLIKETTHPAGFQLFGEVVITSDANIRMPKEQPPIRSFTTIELPPVQITNITSRRQVTNIFHKYESLIVEEGVGSVSVDTFDSSETLAFDVSLSPEFDGDFDSSTGQLVGRTSFTLIDKKTGNPLSLNNDTQLFVTLDGVFQEPGVSYTVSGSNITFSAPPFGTRVVEGQDVESVKFYGRAILFKNSQLTNQYFRKLKSISDQFDGVRFDFELYYEDGSIVKTDPNENLIVGLNGVIQKARQNFKEPFGNSYYIDRSQDPLKTDRIIFSKPPIDNEDAYEVEEEIPESLKNYEKCFIYSVGSYERLTIDESLYEYRGAGPYLILDEVKKNVRKIDEPNYALVFIDGVLQREGDAYSIVGPNITFTKNLSYYVDENGIRTAQDVNIILLYGRDLPKTITFYDFERYTYNNIISLVLSGPGITSKITDLYSSIGGDNIYLKQENGNVLGKLLVLSDTSQEDQITIKLQNPYNADILDPNSPVIFVNQNDFTTEIVQILIPDNYSYSWNVETDGADILVDDGGSISTVNNLPTINGYTGEAGNILSFDVSVPGYTFYIMDSLQYADKQNLEFTVRNLNSTEFEFDDSNGVLIGSNPNIDLTVGDNVILNINLEPGHEFYVLSEDPTNGLDLGSEVETITADRTSGFYIFNTSGWEPGMYYYVCANHPSSMVGTITVSPYTGSFYNGNKYFGNEVINNELSEGTVLWDLTNAPAGTYYYTIDNLSYYGVINIIDGGDRYQNFDVKTPKEYLIVGDYSVSSTYETDDLNQRLLSKNITPWLFGTKIGEEAWENKNSLLANLISGDKILIDGESEYRDILSTPNKAISKTYRNTDLAQSNYYSKVVTSNYEGITRGEGLSVNAIVNQYGEVTSLDVADIEYNKRDLNLYFERGVLLQPTAYQYFSTPVLHFIPVDGNGGGAKAEVIAYGGQILDIVLTNPGSGYTQPPRVVVARKYKRIKQQNRKIDSLTVLSITPEIIVKQEITYSSQITIEGAGNTSQFFSIITFGGLIADVNSDSNFIEHVYPAPLLVRMTDEAFPTQIFLGAKIFQLPTIEYNTVTLVTQVIGGVAGAEAIVSSQKFEVDQITKIVQIPVNKAFRQEKSDSINGVGSFLDAPMDLDDTIAYVANTSRFPDTPSRLRIGREVIYYTGKKPDRFTGLLRGYQNSPLETHDAGDLVLHYPEFVTMVTGGVTIIHSQIVLSGQVIHDSQTTATIQSISDVSNLERKIEIEEDLQIEIDRTDISVPHQEILIIPPPSYNVITSIYSTVTTIRLIDTPIADIVGAVSSEIVTIEEITTDIRGQQQISVDVSDVITSVTVTSVAVNTVVNSSSGVVRSSYDSTLLTVTCQLERINTVSAISTKITETIATAAVETYSSIRATLIQTTSQVNATVLSVLEEELGALNSYSVIEAAVVDINTFSTTVSAVIGSLGVRTQQIDKIYRMAVIDYYIEDYVLQEQVTLRDETVLILDSPINEVELRNGVIFVVANKSQPTPDGIENYTLGNVGVTLGSLEHNIYNDGGINNSFTIESFNMLYPTISIADFDIRENSAITSDNKRFNLGIPSYQSPYALVATQVDSSLTNFIIETSQNLEYFKSSGVLYLAQSNEYFAGPDATKWWKVTYTGKSGNTFTGCTIEESDGSSVLIGVNSQIVQVY